MHVYKAIETQFILRIIYSEIPDFEGLIICAAVPDPAVRHNGTVVVFDT